MKNTIKNDSKNCNRVKKQKDIVKIKLTKNEIKDIKIKAQALDHEIKNIKEGRRKNICKMRDERLYKYLGYKSFKSYIRKGLKKFLSDYKVENLLGLDAVCKILNVNSSDYKDNIIKPLISMKMDVVAVNNVWDKANNYAKNAVLDKKHIEKSIFLYKKNHYISRVSKQETDILEKICDLSVEKRRELIKVVSGMC